MRLKISYKTLSLPHWLKAATFGIFQMVLLVRGEALVVKGLVSIENYIAKRLANVIVMKYTVHKQWIL